MIRTQHCIHVQLNTEAKETQQLNPGGPDNRLSIGSVLSFIDKLCVRSRLLQRHGRVFALRSGTGPRFDSHLG